MTPERIEQERKAFEEWYYDSIGDTRLPLDKYENGCYCNPNAEDMFTAWCAAKSHSAQSEWISVEDRLPDECNMVFIWLGGDGVTLSAYDSICGWAFIDQMDAEKVKFWSPVILPEPPETRGK